MSTKSVLQFVCGYPLFWTFIFAFCLVQTVLVAFAFLAVQPGTATYVILVLDVVGVAALLTVTLAVHWRCGFGVFGGR